MLAQKQLEEVDRELESAAAEEREITSRLDANAKALNETEAMRRQREQSRQNLRAASEALSERQDLSKQVATLQTERDRQVLERSEADSRLIVSEAALSKAIASHAEAERAVASVRSELAGLESLLEDLPQLEQDTAILAEIQTRFLKTQNELQEAEERQTRAANSLRATGVSREALLPEYERALAEQADLDALLDSIQVHVHEASCPLCGSQFDSVESLLARIRRQRDPGSRRGDVTIRYKGLAADEAQASDLLRVASTSVSAAKATIEELIGLRGASELRLTRFRERLAAVNIEYSGADVMRQALVVRQQDLEKRIESLGRTAEAVDRDLKALQASQTQETARRRTVHERITSLERGIKELSDRMGALDARISRNRPGDQTVDRDLGAEIAQTDRSIEETVAAIAQLQAVKRIESEKTESLNARKRGITDKRKQLLSRLAETQQSITGFRQKLRQLQVPDDDVDSESLDRVVQQTERHAEAVRQLAEKGRVVISALQARETRLQLLEKQAQLDLLKTKLAKLEEQQRRIQEGLSVCEAIDKLLKRERQGSIERHINAYGPMITMIQQRLRSVYGFGGVHLEARGGEATVQVEWRNKNVQVPPTDFFSDSQRQILMLSIFLAGGLRQNWSGFAPVLLDDPVTHFDDLNAYGFVELVRGIISTSPSAWQFIISTCEERLFALMQKKFSRLPSGAIFYEFVGMSEKGPIVERR